MNNLDQAKEAAVSFMNGAYPYRTWFIVGGALRDTELGVPMKDVDIFVSGYDTDPEPDAAEDGARNAYLLRAYTTPWEGFALNIIFLRGVWSLERVTDRCDFGICQIGYDPVTRITYRSPNYLRDISEKTITVCRATVPERRHRMATKFPDRTIRNPSNFAITNKSKVFQYNALTGAVDSVPVLKQ